LIPCELAVLVEHQGDAEPAAGDRRNDLLEGSVATDGGVARMHDVAHASQQLAAERAARLMESIRRLE